MLTGRVIGTVPLSIIGEVSLWLAFGRDELSLVGNEPVELWKRDKAGEKWWAESGLIRDFSDSSWILMKHCPHSLQSKEKDPTSSFHEGMKYTSYDTYEGDFEVFVSRDGFSHKGRV